MPISPFLTDEEKRRQAVLAETGMTPAEYGDSPDYHAAVAAASPAITPAPETATPVAGGPTETDFAPKAVKPNSAPAQMEFEPLDVSGKAPPAPAIAYPALDITPKTTALDGPIPDSTDAPPAAQPEATTPADTKPVDQTGQMIAWMKKKDAEDAEKAKAAQQPQFPPQLLAALGLGGLGALGGGAGLLQPMSKEDKIRRDLYYTFANKDLPESAFSGMPEKGGANALGSILKAQEAQASLAQRQLEFRNKDARAQTLFLQAQPGGADAQGIDAYLIANKPEEVLKMGGVGPLKAMSYPAKLKLAGLINTDAAQAETERKNQATEDLANHKQTESERQFVVKAKLQEQGLDGIQAGREAQLLTGHEKTIKDQARIDSVLKELVALDPTAVGATGPGAGVDPTWWDKFKHRLPAGIGTWAEDDPRRAAWQRAFGVLNEYFVRPLAGANFTKDEKADMAIITGNLALGDPKAQVAFVDLARRINARQLAQHEAAVQVGVSPKSFDAWRKVGGVSSYDPLYKDVFPGRAEPSADSGFTPIRQIIDSNPHIDPNEGRDAPVSEDDSGDEAGGSDAPSEPASTVVKSPNVQALPGQRVVPNDGAPVGKNPTLPSSPTAYRAQHPSQPPPATNRSQSGGAASKSSQKIRVSNGKESFLIDPADEVHAAAEGFKRVK